MLEFHGGWLNLFRDPRTQPSRPQPAIRKPPSPDYESLVDALINIGVPDGAGELALCHADAACIRHAGWSAHPGCWRCPVIPWEFIARYPRLWHLADDLDPAGRSMPWHPRRAAFRRIVGADLGKEENRILRTIDRAGRITREKLL